MSSPPDPVPPRVPDYELLRRIGGGSYGDVWIARSVVGAVYRGVKIVTRDRFPDARPYEREYEGLKRFIAVSLRHPGHLALLHAGRNEEAGYFYYVMELADDANTGRHIDPERYVPLTLRTMLRLKGRLPIDDVLDIGVPLAGALANLHAARLVHRDIKPSNIIVVDDIPKLADIGLVTELNEAGTVVGTPGYVPLEGSGTIVGDIYGLGKVLYELATGLSPHEWPLMPDLDEMPERSAFLDLNETLIRACSENPRERFTDASVLRQELRDIQKGRSIRRERMLRRYLRRATQIAAVLAVIAAIGGGGMWIQYERARAAEAERDELARRKTYSGNLASAQRALQTAEYGRARRLLEELAPPKGSRDLRGFEWRALAHEARGDTHDTWRATGPAISRLALSPDESLLAVHDDGQTITLYDVAENRERRRISGVWLLAGFSSDGRWLVGADRSAALQRWSVTDGRPEAPGVKTDWRPIAVAGADSAAVVSNLPAVHAALWNFDSHAVQDEVDLETATSTLPWVRFRTGASIDGRTLAIAWIRGSSSEAEFRLTSVRLGAAGEVQHHLLGHARPSAVGVDSEGPWAVLDVSGVMWRETNGTWKETDTRLPPSTRKYLVAHDRDTSFAVAAHGPELSWLTSEGTNRLGRGHGALVVDLIANTTRREIYSAAMDGTLFRWPWHGPTSPPDHLQVWNSNAGTTCAVFTPEGRHLWVPWDGQSCARLNVDTLAPSSRAEGMLWPVAVTRRGLLGIGVESGLLLVDSESGRLLERLAVSLRPLKIAAEADDGRMIAAIDQTGDLFALTTAGAHRVQPGWSRYFMLCLDRSGRRLFATNTNRLLQCLSWPDGKILWQQELPAIAPFFLLSPGEAELVVALENGSLELRSAISGQLLRQVDAGSAAPQTLALAPAGERLFVGGLDGDIHYFDTNYWEEVHTYSLGRTERLQRLVSSPDGATLVSLTKTGMLHIIRTR